MEDFYSIEKIINYFYYKNKNLEIKHSKDNI